MAIFNLLTKKNCSNCGWNIYAKDKFTNNAVKVKCTCDKKCIKYNQWKPTKTSTPPDPPKPGLKPKNNNQEE